MTYTTKAPIWYIKAGTGDLCERLNIRLTPMPDGATTEVQGSIFALISFFTALAEYYRLSLSDIKAIFA